MNFLLESAYFPPVAHFAIHKRADTVIIDDRERFIKQTYRSRALLLSSNGIQNLSVPVQKGKTTKSTGEVGISYREDWPRKHLQAIQSNYGKAAYFDHYFDDLQALLNQHHGLLIELNMAILTWLKKRFQLSTKTCLLSQSGGNDYLDAKDIYSPRSAVSPSKPYYKVYPFYQCFGEKFNPNLSSLDLLFNMGPESATVLAKSIDLSQLWEDEA